MPKGESVGSIVGIDINKSISVWCCLDAYKGVVEGCRGEWKVDVLWCGIDGCKGVIGGWKDARDA